MIKFILTCMMFFVFTTYSNASHAAGCDAMQMPRGTSDSVIIEMKKKCLELVPQNSPIFTHEVPATTQELGEYAELGKKYGFAMVEVAKAIGVTVNELAQTPVGIFMLIMVAYKVMGNDLLGVIGSMIWFSTMIPLWLYMFHRMVFNSRKIEETMNDKGKVISRVKHPVIFSQLNRHGNEEWTDQSVWALLLMGCFVLLCAAGFLMAFG